MHNAAAASLGLDLVYVPLPVRPGHLEAAIRGLPALGFRGANITVPHKNAVLPLLDQIDPAAKAIGAVNTIVIRDLPTISNDLAVAKDSPSTSPDSQLVGYNTDWSGFMADLTERGIEPSGEECLILGAGGSARAVAYGLASAGNRIHIIARRQEQAISLASDLTSHCSSGEIVAHPWQALQTKHSQFDSIRLIVNCTPAGMSPHVDVSPWPEELSLPKHARVYDLIYNPTDTRLMKQARAAGCQAVNGLGMLLHQGAQAFYLWTAKQPDLRIMAAALG